MTKIRTGGMAWRQIMQLLTKHQADDNAQLSKALKLILTDHPEEAAEIIVKLTNNGQFRMQITALLSANGIREVDEMLKLLPPNGEK